MGGVKKEFVLFAVLLCFAMGAFLAIESPKYAPFVIDASIESKGVDILKSRAIPKNHAWGGAEQKSLTSQNQIKQNQIKQKHISQKHTSQNQTSQTSPHTALANDKKTRIESHSDKLPYTTSLTLSNNAKSAHSSSIVDLGERLMVVYFAGSREGASDVAIMQHFIRKDTLESTPQRVILDAKMLSLMSGKFIKKLGNPVIFKGKNGAVHLFVVGVSLGGWATSRIYQLSFRSDLQSLDFVGELRLGLLANLSHLVRTPPILLKNGGFALPLYHELARKYALVGFFDENARFSHALRINSLKNQLQPTIITLNERECLAFFRNHKAHKNASFLQKCDNFGETWEMPKATNLKGYDDSPLLTSYTNAQNAPRILLIYNDGRRLDNGEFVESGNTRQSLGLYALQNISDSVDLRQDLAHDSMRDSHDSDNFKQNSALDSMRDSTQDFNKNCTRDSMLNPAFDSTLHSTQGADILAFQNAIFSTNFAFLQNIDFVSAPYPNEVSYPSAIISGEWLFVSWTHNRKNIKIARLNLSHLEAKIAQMANKSSTNQKINHCANCYDLPKPSLATTTFHSDKQGR